MKRLLAGIVLLALASTATADLLPPTPKGFKRVATSHRVTTEKEFPEFSLFLVKILNVAPAMKSERTAAPAKLDAKTPLSIVTGSGASVSTSYELVAVPKDAGKEFANEKDFHKAIADGKVPGQLTSKTVFAGSGSTLIKETDARKEVVTQHKLEKIDAKDGIVLATEKATDPVPPPPGCDDADEIGTVTAAPKHGSLIAGLGVTAALLLTGFWLAGRNRRRAISS